MKYRWAHIILCLILVISCTIGCGLVEQSIIDEAERQIEQLAQDTIPDDTIESVLEDDEKQLNNVSPKEPADTEEVEPEETSDEDAIDDDGAVEDVSSSSSLDDLETLSDEEIAGCAANNAGRYAYETLNESDRRIYNQINLGLNKMTDGVAVDTQNTDTIGRIFQCVMMDHPEIFWVTGFTYTKYTLGGELVAIGFKGTYPISNDERASRQSAIEQAINTCLSGMPGGDDYSKIKYVYEYIVLNTEYDMNSPDNQNICSVLLNHRSVCQGYAKTMQILLNRAGIMCTLVSGVTASPDGNQNHTWNLVKSGGNYYYVDCTWGDASYRTADGYEGSIPSISYDYLCITYDQLHRTHTLGTPVAMPACTSMQDNYFVREGAYFTGVDEEGLRNLFNRYYEAGRSNVVIKASDGAIYNVLKTYLIDDQNVFKYLREGSETVSFWENTTSNTLSFNL